MTRPAPWTLEAFLPRLDDWETQEHPLDELRVAVLDWIFTRAEDPYVNAKRIPGFADYWQAVVPGSDHFDDHAERCAVVCLYWIDAAAFRVRCDRFASLSLPIG